MIDRLPLASSTNLNALQLIHCTFGAWYITLDCQHRGHIWKEYCLKIMLVKNPKEPIYGHQVDVINQYADSTGKIEVLSSPINPTKIKHTIQRTGLWSGMHVEHGFKS